MLNRHALLVAAALVLLAAFGTGAYLYRAQQSAEFQRNAVHHVAAFVRAESPARGAVDAKVQLVEFFDPGCEACRMMHPYVKSLLRTYDGKVRLVLRYATFHEGSEYVARILEAARLQSDELYWKTLDSVLEQQMKWASHERPNAKLVWSFLEGSGLDLERARREMNDPRITSLLVQDARDLAALNVQKTPSFFVNGKPLVNFGPIGLRALIDEEVKGAYR